MEEGRLHSARHTLLVFNCHEPWVYQLGVLGYGLDIIIGLAGRYTQMWDARMRPAPENCRFLTLAEALHSKTHYYCIITHNIKDLLDVRERAEPRLLVVHSTLEGRVEEEKSGVSAEEMKQMLHKYVELTNCHVVATSATKGESWGFTEDIVTFGIDARQYLPYSGEEPCGIRVCNFINSRRRILLWDFYQEAFAGIPMRLVGHNPGMAGVAAADSWDHLKRILRSYRFYVHTAEPKLEAGYNMASIEAMAAGLPVLGNLHPTSPVKHGVSGFLSDDPSELGRYAQMLVDDRRLARLMGQKARKTAIECFPMSKFRESFLRSIETSRRKWQNRPG